MTALKDGVAPRQFSRVGALRHTQKINDAADALLDLIVEAWLGRIWEALDDVDDFASYVEVYAPRVKTFTFENIDARRDAVAHWSTLGMPQRDMARIANVSNGTIAADAKVVVPFDKDAKTRSKDGSLRPRRIATVTPIRPESLTLREKIVDLCRDAGERGMTRKELIRALKKDGGTVSGALTPLSKNGRLIVSDLVRENCRAYIAPPLTEEN